MTAACQSASLIRRQEHSRQKFLLIAPPLWNVFAPHLALPLLAASLRRAGVAVECFDASTDLCAWVLSADGQQALADWRRETAGRSPGHRRAEALYQVVGPTLEEAGATIRDVEAFRAWEPFEAAWRTTLQAATIVSDSFPGLSFDLNANAGYYDHRTSGSVRQSTTDPLRNVYRWALERTLPKKLSKDIICVGISVSADTQLIGALTTAQLVRELRPDIHILFGGNYVTRLLMRDRCFPRVFEGLVDSVILFEAEETLVHFATSICSGLPPSGVASLVSPMFGSHQVPSEVPPVNFRNLPCPDFDDLPLDKYFAPEVVFPLLASRGCQWDCAFCSIPFASNAYRNRPGTAVSEDMANLQRRWGARSFIFVDEIMTIRSLREVSDAILNSGLDVRWFAETRFAPSLTPAVAKKLYESGCRRLELGLESSSQRVLDLMRKGVSREWIEQNLVALQSASVPFHLFTILGFPGEKPEEAETTLRFVKDIVQQSRRSPEMSEASYGVSPFVLDELSPIGRTPLDFGIVSVAPRDEKFDLSFELAYSVAPGLLTPEMARRLTDNEQRHLRAEDVYRHHVPTKFDQEELAFLRTVHHARIRKSPRVVHPLLGSLTGVSIRRRDDTVAWRDEKVLVVGRPRTQIWFEVDTSAVPPDFLTNTQSWHKVDDLAPKSSLPDPFIRGLIRYDLVEASEYRPLMKHDVARLKLAWDVATRQIDEVKTSLTSRPSAERAVIETRLLNDTLASLVLVSTHLKSRVIVDLLRWGFLDLVPLELEQADDEREDQVDGTSGRRERV